MWFWIIVAVLVVLIILEESIYYLWNRYVYGPNKVRNLKWKKRMATKFESLTGLRGRKVSEKNSESPDSH